MAESAQERHRADLEIGSIVFLAAVWVEIATGDSGRLNRRMPHPLSTAVLVWLVCIMILPVGNAAESSKVSSYVEHLASARALATEGSHALAHAAFAEALAVAPDETQRRWCQLWILTEELANPDDSTMRRVVVGCRQLLEPYEKHDATRDSFWTEKRRGSPFTLPFEKRSTTPRPAARAPHTL